VPEQKLNGSKVPGSSVDQSGLCPPERVRAEFQRVEADTGDPLADEARILSGRQSTSRTTASGEQELAGLPVRYAQVVVEGLARLFRQFEPDWAASFLLPDSRAVETVPIRGDVIDAHRHDVAASKLAVDREVEQGEIACSSFNMQFRSYRPDMAGPKRRLGSDELALVPRLA
jgi:hypothetical protein